MVQVATVAERALSKARPEVALGRAPEAPSVLGACSLGQVALGIGPQEVAIRKVLDAISDKFDTGNRGVNAAISSKLRKDFGNLGAALLKHAAQIDRLPTDRLFTEGLSASLEELRALREQRREIKELSGALEKYCTDKVGDNARGGFLGDLKALREVASNIGTVERATRTRIVQDTRLHEGLCRLKEGIVSVAERSAAKLSERDGKDSLDLIQTAFLARDLKALADAAIDPRGIRVNTSAFSYERIREFLSSAELKLSDEQKKVVSREILLVGQEASRLHHRISSTLQVRYLPKDESIELTSKGASLGAVSFHFDAERGHTITIKSQPGLLESTFRVNLPSDPRAFKGEVEQRIATIKKAVANGSDVSPLEVALSQVQELSGVGRPTIRRIVGLFKEPLGDMQHGAGGHARREEPKGPISIDAFRSGQNSFCYTLGGTETDWNRMEFHRATDGTRSLRLETGDKKAQIEFDLGKGGLNDEDIQRLLAVVQTELKNYPFSRTQQSQVEDYKIGGLVEILLDPARRKELGLEFVGLKHLKGGVHSHLSLSKEVLAKDCIIENCGFNGGAFAGVSGVQFRYCAFVGAANLNLKSSETVKFDHCSFGSQASPSGRLGDGSSVMNCFFSAVPKGLGTDWGVTWRENTVSRRFWFGTRALGLKDLPQNRA